MLRRRLRWTLIGLPAALLLTTTVAVLLAQDQDDQQTATQKYEQKFKEWKDVLKGLRKLRSEYQTVPEAEVPKIRQQWDELITRGEELLIEVRAAAIAAYAERPNQDRELTRFLVKLLEDDVAHDDYDEAMALSKVLLDNKAGFPEIYAAAGTAAFAMNEFEAAESHLANAEAAGQTQGPVAELRQQIIECRDLWKAEQEIRAKEAAADDLPRVKLTTSKGEITVELFENEAPNTVGNFVSLVEKGFYKDLAFHRVLPGFMAQVGCPNGDGTGGPGYEIYDEFETPNARQHFRGSLSMAKATLPNTGGSQFFLTFRPTPELNGKHTVFGRVIDGMDVLRELQRRDPDAETQATPDRLIKAELLRKRDHEYRPDKVQ